MSIRTLPVGCCPTERRPRCRCPRPRWYTDAIRCRPVRRHGPPDQRATSPDGALEVRLSPPRALVSAGGSGTHPEQPFAAGYSACFLGALKFVSGKQRIARPVDTTVTGEVGIAAALTIRVTGLPRDQAESLVEQAHVVCPYSNATRGNIDVTLTVA